MRILQHHIQCSRLWLVALVAAFGLSSCGEVVLVIDELPPNTPAGAAVYVSGNFNYWDPGDRSYRLEMQADSTWTVSLPPGVGTLEFKFTRGDWTTVETDLCGYTIDNRTTHFAGNDTINMSVLSWKDLDPVECPQVTLVLKGIPENTPIGERITLAGSWNNWRTDDSTLCFSDSGDGPPTLTLTRPPESQEELEFLLTRGSLETSESDELGHGVPARKISWGSQDTIFLDVTAWQDVEKQQEKTVTFLVDELPASTDDFDDIYLVGNFNGWFPRDRRLILKRTGSGKAYITIPVKTRKMEFKFTRGDWGRVEVDAYGNEINNRTHSFKGPADTVNLSIANWRDHRRKKAEMVTFVVTKLPEGTPSNARLYMTSNHNGWKARSRRHEFKRNASGQYELILPTSYQQLDFKVTRGSWNSVEAGTDGNERENRHFQFRGEQKIYLEIDSWKDQPTGGLNDVVIVLESIPESTPEKDDIYFACSCNNWNPKDKNAILQRDDQGRHYIRVPRTDERIEFKFTRGGWNTVEAKRNGQDTDDRRFRFGLTDSLYVSVQRWKDR